MITFDLANGCTVRSGWNDECDPDALPAGDWFAVDDADGNQLCYIDSADLVVDRIDLE